LGGAGIDLRWIEVVTLIVVCLVPRIARIVNVCLPGVRFVNDAGVVQGLSAPASWLHATVRVFALKRSTAVGTVLLAGRAVSRTSVGAERELRAPSAKRVRASSRGAPTRRTAMRCQPWRGRWTVIDR
jgi:hypothetical protein